MSISIKAPRLFAGTRKPTVSVPQSNLGSSVASGLLNAAVDIAQEYRDHKQAVNYANSLADSYEKAGLIGQAQGYRAAAKSFDLNFLGSREQNKASRDALLRDSLSFAKMVTDVEQGKRLAAVRDLNADTSSKRQASADRLGDERIKLYRDRLAADISDKESQLELSRQRLANDSENLELKRQYAEDTAAYREMQSRLASANADLRKRAEDRMQLESDAKIDLMESQAEKNRTFSKLSKERAERLSKSMGAAGGKTRLTTRSDGTWDLSVSGLTDDQLNEFIASGEFPSSGGQGENQSPVAEPDSNTGSEPGVGVEPPLPSGEPGYFDPALFLGE